jgi:hypothetical protein
MQVVEFEHVAHSIGHRKHVLLTRYEKGAVQDVQMSAWQVQRLL